MARPSLSLKSKIITSSPRETMRVGRWLGRRLKPGAAICLSGDLSAGKTTLIKGIALGMGLKVDISAVGSPSFVLIREYPCRIPLHHVDLYRLDTIEATDTELIAECLEKPGVTVVEWGDKALDFFPKNYLRVEMSHADRDRRRIKFLPKGEFELLEKKGNGEWRNHR